MRVWLPWDVLLKVVAGGVKAGSRRPRRIIWVDDVGKPLPSSRSAGIFG